MDLIGLTVPQAKEILHTAGIRRVTVRESINDKQGRADTMLVVRVRINGDEAELVATPFIMKV